MQWWGRKKWTKVQINWWRATKTLVKALGTLALNFDMFRVRWGRERSFFLHNTTRMWEDQQRGAQTKDSKRPPLLCKTVRTHAPPHRPPHLTLPQKTLPGSCHLATHKWTKICCHKFKNWAIRRRWNSGGSGGRERKKEAMPSKKSTKECSEKHWLNVQRQGKVACCPSNFQRGFEHYGAAASRSQVPRVGRKALE